MWHELRVVMHNRENTLVTQALNLFAREEYKFAEEVMSNWAKLVDACDAMPYE
jgi:sorting nexin-8